jgi:nucleoside 2-deoxyribosyltransferase
VHHLGKVAGLKGPREFESLTLRKMKIYLASPMANTASKEKWEVSEASLSSNLEIKKALLEAGHEVFLPQELDQSDLNQTFIKELGAIRDSDCVVAVLGDTRGVYCEIGYAYGIGKPIYALEIQGTRPMSQWGHNWFKGIYKSMEELIKALG